MVDVNELNLKLKKLKKEHRNLDELIERLINAGTTDQLQIQRHKKNKLLVKDQIIYYANKLLPNIIA